MKLFAALKKLIFRLKLNNFAFTTIAKVSDLGLKSGILFFFVFFRTNNELVDYTYFLSLGAILGVIFDWGGSRQNVRSLINSNVLTLNLISIVISVITFVIIYNFNIIKFNDVLFLLLCIIYSLTTSVLMTFMRYYEYINNNKELYKVQVIVNIICSILIIVLTILKFELIYLYICLILANLLIIMKCFAYNFKLIKVKFSCNLFRNGLPFLISSLAVMAFSQINIVLLNQFANPFQIANFVVAQRIMEVSLILPNSYTSSEIGKFLKGKVKFSLLQAKTIKLWMFSFFVCLLVTIFLFYNFKEYSLILYIFILLIPLGFVRSVSSAYSITIDYTKYYLIRTYCISIILILNLTFAQFILKLPHGLYIFCLYIGALMIALQATYLYTFKKFNIYEAFYR